jgi:asparagine synthase (glutamine-hydrolysing)
MLRIRGRYGTWPALGTGVIAKWRGLRGRSARPGSERIPFPEWIEPGLVARLGLRERWEAFWTWHPAPRNERHPLVHEALIGPEWNLEETYLDPGFTPPDHCDPFLDPRLIEFVLSLPPLPWLFRKHLLREAMAGRLPEDVLRRPKTALGEIHESLLAQPEAHWIETWTPRQEILQYLDLRQLAPYQADGDNYLALRPLLLDRWVGAIDEALALG